MANFISIFRIFVMFYAVYLIYSCEGNTVAYIWALFLTIVAFALDGLDGYIARKFNEESKFGALLDIMGDRIVENTYWILFAVMGWINIFFPIIVLTRGFVTDTNRTFFSIFNTCALLQVNSRRLMDYVFSFPQYGSNYLCYSL